ncbi:uncharacterized protein [Henckelia pumila]|uniref:uncharacterized protein isoform X2 n=1 Tax=Henckelia pumila TaxID=405737 RepID=UPI003C6E722B
METGLDVPDIPFGMLTDRHLKRCEDALLEFVKKLKRQKEIGMKGEAMWSDFSQRMFTLMLSTRPFIFRDSNDLADHLRARGHGLGRKRGADVSTRGCLLFVLPVFKNKAKAIVAENKRKGHGDGTLGMLSWLIVAVLDGSLNVLITNPIWVLVTRMQTHTKAEKKIMEAKKEALLKEASENILIHPSLPEQLAALDSIQPRPYGTFQGKGALVIGNIWDMYLDLLQSDYTEGILRPCYSLKNSFFKQPWLPPSPLPDRRNRFEAESIAHMDEMNMKNSIICYF